MARPKLMSHEERQKLIRLPFRCAIIGGTSWGGASVHNSGSVPTEGHRTWSGHVTPEDELYLVSLSQTTQTPKSNLLTRRIPRYKHGRSAKRGERHMP